MRLRDTLVLITMVSLAGSCDRTYHPKETFSESGSSFDCVHTDSSLMVRPLKFGKSVYSCERESDSGKTVEESGWSFIECAVLDTRTEASPFYINRSSEESCTVALQDSASFVFSLASADPPAVAVSFLNNASITEYSIDLTCTQGVNYSHSEKIEPGTGGGCGGTGRIFQTDRPERGDDHYSAQASCYIRRKPFGAPEYCVEYMSGWSVSNIDSIQLNCTSIDGAAWAAGGTCKTWGSMCPFEAGDTGQGEKRIWTAPDVDFWPGTQVNVTANDEVCAATKEKLAELGL